MTRYAKADTMKRRTPHEASTWNAMKPSAQGFKPRNMRPFRQGPMKPRKPWVVTVNQNAGESGGFQQQNMGPNNQNSPVMPGPPNSFNPSDPAVIEFQQKFMMAFMQTQMMTGTPWFNPNVGENSGIQRQNTEPTNENPTKPPWANNNVGGGRRPFKPTAVRPPWANRNVGGGRRPFQQTPTRPRQPWVNKSVGGGRRPFQQSPMRPRQPWVNKSVGESEGFQQKQPPKLHPHRTWVNPEITGKQIDLPNSGSAADNKEETNLDLNASGPGVVSTNPLGFHQKPKRCFMCGATDHFIINCIVKKQLDTEKAQRKSKKKKTRMPHRRYEPIRIVEGSGGVVVGPRKNKKIKFDDDEAEEPSDTPMESKLAEVDEAPGEQIPMQQNQSLDEAEEPSDTPMESKLSEVDEAPEEQIPMQQNQSLGNPNDEEKEGFQRPNKPWANHSPRGNVDFQPNHNQSRFNFNSMQNQGFVRTPNHQQQMIKCFHCGENGHRSGCCPSLPEDQKTGCCYKCGSIEHKSRDCKLKNQTSMPFANCYICKKSGHIARDCPDNTKGIYPNGGGCLLCSSNEHLKVDCPTLKKQKVVKEDDVVDRIQNNGSADAEDSFLNLLSNSIEKDLGKGREKTVAKSVVF